MACLPGMEWIEVPNPIQTDPGSGMPGEPGYVPPTYDTRHVDLVKFAHDSEADQQADGGMTDVDGQPSQSVRLEPIPGMGKDELDRSYRARQLLDQWTAGGGCLEDQRAECLAGAKRPERFGVWQ